MLCGLDFQRNFRRKAVIFSETFNGFNAVECQRKGFKHFQKNGGFFQRNAVGLKSPLGKGFEGVFGKFNTTITVTIL